MAGTASGRNIRYRIVFCNCIAAGACQEACLAADADFFDRRRHFKFFFRKVFVDPLHYLLPQFSVETPVACRNLRLNVVSGPDSGGIVRGEARKYQVRVIVGGTRFPATAMPSIWQAVPVPLSTTSSIALVRRYAVLSRKTWVL